VRREHWE